MEDDLSKASGPSALAEKSTTAIDAATSDQSMQGVADSNKPKTPEPQQGNMTRFKPRYARDRLRVKTKRARSRVLILIAYLAYIITLFTTLSIGLQGLSTYLTSCLHNAEVKLRAQGSLRYREQMLYTRLDKLLSTRLSGRFMETYEDCLARSLQDANQQFFGLGFRYPDIRDQTIDWAVDNCGRLLYTPQLSNPNPQQAVLTRWTLGTYRACRLTDKFYGLVTSAWSRWLDKIRSSLSGTDDAASLDVQAATYNYVREVNSYQEHTRMPFGFDLNCEGSSPCRPIYSSNAGTPTDKATISNEDLMGSIRKVQELSAFCDRFNAFQHLMASLALFFVPLEVLCLIAYSVMGIYVFRLAQPRPTKRAKAISVVHKYTIRLIDEERYAAGSIAIQVLAMAAHLVRDQLPGRGGNITMISGISIMMLGVTMLINLFAPVMQLENVFDITKTVKELYVIATCREEECFNDLKPTSTHDPADHNFGKDIADSLRGNMVTSFTPSSLAGSLPSTLPTLPRQVSVATTAQQDLRNELKAMRETRKHHAYVESDSELESDGNGFVDLAGGITLTTTEVESDWFFVDA